MPTKATLLSQMDEEGMRCNISPPESKRRRVYSANDSQRYQENRKAVAIYDQYTGGDINTVLERECLTTDELSEMCLQGTFSSVGDDVKRRVFNRAQKRLSLFSFLSHVCTVCDCRKDRHDVGKRRPKEKTARKWCEKLCGNDEIPQDLRKLYDVSEWIPSLKGALLSRNGLCTNRDGEKTVQLFLCKTGLRALQSSRNPPKFAIANGFEIGYLPTELSRAKPIEYRMTSLTTIATSITLLRGGKHKAIKSRTSIYRMNPGTIAKRLPQLLEREDEKFLVFIVGQMTEPRKVLAMKKHVARTDIVMRLLQFYEENNELFRIHNIEVDEEGLETLRRSGGHCGILVEEVNGLENCSVPLSGNLDENDGCIQTRNQRADGAEVTNELSHQEKRAIFIDENPLTTVEAVSEAGKTLVVRNGSRFVSDYDRDLLGLAFPELFPFGRGHPGTNRPVKVSLEECRRHYLELPDLCFAKHESFVMVAFDICGRRRVATSTTVRSKGFVQEFETIGKFTAEQLVSALHEQRRRREKILSGQGSQQQLNNRANLLLGNVRIAQSRIWGSGQERLQYRRKAFSMDAFLKTGAVFVTITPSDTGSLLVAIFADKISPETLHAMETDELPSHAQRFQISSNDPVACTQYFELICDVFIEECVGFNISKGLPYRDGGLFGHVRAFLGAVEAQKSGTLHMHAILFVAGLPRGKPATNNMACICICTVRTYGERLRLTF